MRAGPTNEKGASGEASWQGVVTDMILPDWSHIAGSAWCRSGKPVWLGVARQPHRLKKATATATATEGESEGESEGMLLAAERAAHAATMIRLDAAEAALARIATLATLPPPPPLVEIEDD